MSVSGHEDAFHNRTVKLVMALTKQHTWKVMLQQLCEPSVWRHGAAAAAAAGAAAVRQVANGGAEPQLIKSCPVLVLVLVLVVQADCPPLSLQVSTTRPPPSSWTAAE